MNTTDLDALGQHLWEKEMESYTTWADVNVHLHHLLRVITLVPPPIHKGIWPFSRVFCPKCGYRLNTSTDKETGFGFVIWYHHDKTNACEYEFAKINKIRNLLVGFPNMEP